MTESEPTVLDFVKALLTPWRGAPPVIPPLRADGESSPADESLPPVAEVVLAAGEIKPAAALRIGLLPWASLGILVLMLLAQRSLEPVDGAPTRPWMLGAVLYGAGFLLLIWASWRNELKAADHPVDEERVDLFNVRWFALAAGVLVALGAYVSFSNNRFTTTNVFLWLWALAAFVIAFWLPGQRKQGRRFHIRRGWLLLLLAALGLVVFFRMYQFSAVPSQMVSDQAEKLFDVADILNGQWSIFFPRNTGREAFQFYLTAAIAKWLDTGISFTSLKIGTVLAGLLTLPFIYLLGKELGNRQIGLLAMVFAGIAYWPNIISRFGLRFPFYPFFAAPTLYYLIRGLRTRNRNDFILTGLWLGVGLHGYTPFRIMPFVVVAAIGLYLLHRQARGARLQTIWGLMIIVVMSFLVFIPLLRYWHDYPDMFSFRAFSRVTAVEAPLPGPAGEIFFSNLWRAMTMFAWDDGEIWVISIPHRPALDVVSAALFYLGMGILLIRWIRRRHWADLFLILAVPLMMMPSILSLAFPNENPAVNRASGVLIPVFLIVAIALDAILRTIRARLGAPWGRRIAWGLGLILLLFAVNQNYDLVFNQYRHSFDQGAWNTAEMGSAVRAFGELTGTTETAWVLAFPYWVDGRLVGINGGDPRDLSIWPEQLNTTLMDPRAKLFVVNKDDQNGLNALQSAYPQGSLQIYESKVDESKNFYLFFVPPSRSLVP